MKFNEIYEKWVKNEVFAANYTYRHELESAVNHLNLHFGSREAEEIKGLDVEEYIRTLHNSLNPNNGKPYSKKLMKDIISVGSRVFEFALDNEIIGNVRNPFFGKKKKIPKDAPKNDRKPITDTQQRYILKTPHRAQTAALIMLYCGLRRGEMIALEWNDIDLRGKCISVNKSAVRKDGNHFEVTPHTKNGRDRYITIPDIIISYLERESAVCTSRFVFPQKNGIKIHTESSWEKAWNSYQNQLNYSCYKDCRYGEKILSLFAPQGVPAMLERFTAHQLRHTYCTMLYLAGTDVMTTSQLMGHSSAKVTLDVYTHLDAIYQKLDISSFNDYLDGKFELPTGA